MFVAQQSTLSEENKYSKNILYALVLSHLGMCIYRTLLTNNAKPVSKTLLSNVIRMWFCMSAVNDSLCFVFVYHQLA